MKVAKKVFAIVLVTAVVLLACTACVFGGGNGKKKQYDEPEDFEFEVTATSIKFIDNYTPLCANGEELEYRIGDGEWQDDPLFEGLTPATTYDVFARCKENDNYRASEAHAQRVTTLKAEQSAPSVTYTQVEKTVTVQADPNLEYSFDGGVTYGSNNVYTYQEVGDKTIYVRYKESADKAVGKVQVINVKITGYYGGLGTEESPYLIYTTAHFNALKDETSNNSYFKLMSDLDFSTAAFYQAKCGMSSNFDGNNHKISNIYYVLNTTPAGSAIGVFTSVGTVKNLTLENVKIDYQDDTYKTSVTVGLLAGRALNVQNCKVVGGEISVNNAAVTNVIGGIVGEFSPVYTPENKLLSISNSSADVKINYESPSSQDGSYFYIGGLLGRYINAGDGKDYEVSISKSSADVDIEVEIASGRINAGGLCGSNIFGTISNCYATGSISSNVTGDRGFISIGGLISQVTVAAKDYYRYGLATIDSCYADMQLHGDRTAVTTFIGGISSLLAGALPSGVNDVPTVTNCFFTGSMSVEGTGNTAIMNTVTPTIAGYDDPENCYHADNLTAPVYTSYSTAVSEDTIKTIAWQRDALKFSADIWNFTEGQYPTLK